MSIPEGYIEGLGRDFPYPKRSHLYKGDFENPGLPMCRWGYNRENGTGYSIWRGNVGDGGICKTCMRRALQGLEGVKPSKDKLLKEVYKGYWIHVTKDEYGNISSVIDKEEPSEDENKDFFNMADYAAGTSMKEAMEDSKKEVDNYLKDPAAYEKEQEEINEILRTGYKGDK